MEKRDEFLEDRDDDRGNAIMEDTRISERYEINSLYLKGIVPGAASSQMSEEPGWQDITGGTEPKDIGFSKREIRNIQNASMKRWKEDPIYAGILESFMVFVIGRGVKVTPHDELEEVRKYLEEFDEANRMDGRDRDIVAKSIKAGEVYIRIFKKAANADARIPAIRLLNYWEIARIERDARGTPTHYVRQYEEEGETEVREERIPAADVIHVKFGALDDDHGVPPFQTIIRECAYYEDWRFNRIVLNRLKTAYYLEEIVEGSPAATVSARDATPDASKTSRSGRAIKRMPKPGSKITHNKSIELKWLSPEVKADDAREDGRMIRLSICAGAQCPEFVLGDASNANFASTMVAQNPFVRKIEWLQDFYEAYIKELYSRVIKYGIESKFLPSMSQETAVKERAENVGIIRRVRKMLNSKEQFDDQGNIVQKKPVPTKTSVSVTWPIVISQKVLEETQALQIQQAMGIPSDQTIAHKLGYDWQEEKRLKDAEKEEEEPEPEPEEEPPAPDDEEAKKRDEEIAKGLIPPGGE